MVDSYYFTQIVLIQWSSPHIIFVYTKNFHLFFGSVNFSTFAFMYTGGRTIFKRKQALHPHIFFVKWGVQTHILNELGETEDWWMKAITIHGTHLVVRWENKTDTKPQVQETHYSQLCIKIYSRNPLISRFRDNHFNKNAESQPLRMGTKRFNSKQKK